MKKKFIALLVTAMVLIMPFLASAMPYVRFPLKGEKVNDTANILSAQAITQIQSFSQDLAPKANIDFWVTTVHFLDGMEVQAYAKALFSHWQLPKNAFLLVLSPGEDRYATFAGEDLTSLFSVQNQQQLLSTYLEADFLNLHYDQAILHYLSGLSSYLEKHLSLTLSPPKVAQVPSTPSAVQDPNLLWGEEIKDFTKDIGKAAKNAAKKASSEARKINGGQVFFIILLLLLIFGNRKQKNLATTAGCLGCGCGPLGWLFAILGLSKFFNQSPSKDDDRIYQ